MKKFLFLLTGLMCMLVSCGGGEDSANEPTPTPNPTPNEPTASITMNTNIPSGGLAFDVKGGEKSVDFTTNKDWTVTVAATTGGATWCTASPTSGKQGDATVKFTVKENTDYDDRSVSVTIKAGTASKTFTINQKGAEALLVTTTKYEVEQAGGEIEVEVQANIDYEMEISETAKSWISEATTRALTTHKHTFTIAANEEVEKREGEIVFKSGDKVETVKVYQAGGAVLVLSQNEFNVSDAGEVITIDVKSNIDFGVHMPDADWISNEAATRGMSSHTLKYDIAPNETYDAREAEIVFYDKNSDLKETVKIVQVQKDAIIISNKSYEVKAEGETLEVKLSANVEFDVTMPDVDWISQVTTRGLTEHTLYYKVAENTNEESRSAEIVFTNKESQLSEKIIIVQNPKLQAGYKDGVVTLTEAGTLKELLGNDYLNITSLKVVGPINGDDIYYLRQMAGCEYYRIIGKLISLDLSEAMIVKGGAYYNREDDISSYHYTSTSNNVIGDYMFWCCGIIETIILPNNVTSIGSDAFCDCESLTSVTIPNSVASIGSGAFAHCESLTSVTIPNSVTSIGESAFYGCESLTSVTIPNSINLIDNLTFSGCESLTSVTIPNSVILIGTSAFSGCKSLTSVTIPNSVTSIEKYAFCNCKSLTSATIGNSVTSIGESAFSGCKSLTSVTIPNSVTSIGKGTFSGCNTLTSVTIGNSVTSIGTEAFAECPISSVYISDLWAWCKIYFYGGSGSSNPLHIGAKLYLNNNEVTELVIPEDITEIAYAFYGCASITSVTIPNSVTSIGAYAFSNCNALTSVTIGNSVTSIRGSAFENCKSLTEVYCYATTPPNIYSQTFIGTKFFKQLYVPKGCSSAYKSSKWNDYFNTILEMEE